MKIISVNMAVILIAVANHIWESTVKSFQAEHKGVFYLFLG
jgi:hypothetical protein